MSAEIRRVKMLGVKSFPRREMEQLQARILPRCLLCTSSKRATPRSLRNFRMLRVTELDDLILIFATLFVRFCCRRAHAAIAKRGASEDASPAGKRPTKRT